MQMHNSSMKSFRAYELHVIKSNSPAPAHNSLQGLLHGANDCYPY